MVIFHSYVKSSERVCISWRILYAKLHWFPDMFACFVHTVVLSPSVLFSTWFRFVLLFNVVLYSFSFVCIVLWCVLSCHVISEHVWYVMKWLYGLACLACLHFSLSGLFSWDNHSPTRMVSGQLQKRYCRTYWGGVLTGWQTQKAMATKYFGSKFIISITPRFSLLKFCKWRSTKRFII